ncbi:MAG: coproporphyrinogen III oxidase, partial [Dysgonamonadaceae bacterium]|nr:coproporphyrinogen III oxidase [Dysgonamonadaceae bacterium]
KFSRHNTAYWTGRKYIGIGPAAHSYDHVSRQWSVASLSEYMEGIAHETPRFEKEILDARTRYNEYVMTRLRTLWGLSISSLRETFGEERAARFLRQAQPYLQKGLLLETEGSIRFSTKGIFISDGIISSLMA